MKIKLTLFASLAVFALGGCTHITGDYLVPDASSPWKLSDYAGAEFQDSEVAVVFRAFLVPQNRHEISFSLRAGSGTSRTLDFAPELIRASCTEGSSPAASTSLVEIEEQYGHPKTVAPAKLMYGVIAPDKLKSVLFRIPGDPLAVNHCVISFRDAFPVPVPDLQLHRAYVSTTRFEW